MRRGVENDANPAYAGLGSRATFRTREQEWLTTPPLLRRRRDDKTNINPALGHCTSIGDLVGDQRLDDRLLVGLALLDGISQP